MALPHDDSRREQAIAAAISSSLRNVLDEFMGEFLGCARQQYSQANQVFQS
jgi:hypothetical protein